MSVDVCIVAGIGLPADDYSLLPNEEGLDSWDDIDDDRIVVKGKHSFNAETVNYLLVPGNTMTDILNNEESFFNAIMEYTGDIITRNDLKLISEGGMW